MIEIKFLTVIVIISTLLFGAVETWAFSIVGIATLIFFCVWFFKYGKSWDVPEDKWDRIIYFSLSGFTLYSLLQIVPLPEVLLEIVNPSKYRVLKDFLIESKSLDTLTIYTYASINEIVKLTIYVIIFFLSTRIKDKESIRKIFVNIVIFGFILSCFAIIQKATWNGRIYWFREVSSDRNVFGPFVNRNHYAGFMGMILPLSMSLTLAYRNEKRYFFLLSSVIMSFSLVFSLSRGGIISFLLSTVIFMLLVSRHLSRKRLTGYLIVFASAFFFYFFYLGFSPVIERFAKEGISLKGRPLIWMGTWNAIKDFPIFGTGLGTFRYIFPLYQPGDIGNLNFHYAHNDYLQLLLETGIIGFSLILVFFIGICAKIIRFYRNGPSIIMAGLITSITYILIHSLVDFNLHIPSNAITFSMITGITVAYSSNKKKYITKTNTKRTDSGLARESS